MTYSLVLGNAQEFICGLAILFVLFCFPFLLYLLGNWYFKKRSDYYHDLYQKAVNRALDKNNKNES